MSTTSRVAGAVAAGYLMGRFKKLRLALLVGTAMASPKFRSAAVGLIQDRIPGGAMVGTLGKEVGTKLLDAGKTAATSVVASRIDGFSETLAQRSEGLRKATNGQANKSRSEDKQSADEPEDEAYEDEDSDVAEEPQDEYEDEDRGEVEEPEDEYEQEDSDEAEEPQDEYEDEDSNVTEEPEDEDTKASYDAEADESFDDEPEEPVVRSSRRRRSASPAGRRG